jgi:hypothetical protein
MRKDIKAINEAFLSVISENTQQRSFEAVLDDVMAMYQKGSVTDVSQAIDILNAELGRDLTPREEQEVTSYFDGTDVYAKDAWSSNATDIKPTPADKNASWNPRDWEDEESMGSEDAEESAFSQVDNAETTDAWDPEGEEKKHDRAFFSYWENIVDRMPDDVLESTLYMIKKFNALNDLVKEEYEYRNSMAR